MQDIWNYVLAHINEFNAIYNFIMAIIVIVNLLINQDIKESTLRKTKNTRVIS